MVNNEFVNINDIIASKKKYKYSINKFLEKEQTIFRQQ